MSLKDHSKELPPLSPIMQKIVEYAINKGCSDIHLKTNHMPAIRLYGNIFQMDIPKLTDEEVMAFFRSSYPAADEIELGPKAIDYSWVYNGVRFRCNAFKDNNGLAISLRLLVTVSTDFETLRIPTVLKKMAERKSGLILVTGPTGSGKTTTLTCLVHHLNATLAGHIITLEDPIEYIHSSKKSIISQREIGVDARDYASGIVEALREDPDIILIGEMRDRDSIEAALRAAETGHLVLSTLHTKGAAATITRIIDVFPAEQQDQIRMQLSLNIIGVISQQLLPRADQPGRVLATEVMVNTMAIQNLIRQEKIHMISSTIGNSPRDGMYSMQQSLEELLNRGLISQTDYELYQIVN